MAREPEKPQSGGMQMTVAKRAVKAVATDTGAPPAFGVMWDQINWDQVTFEVTRLQVRIAKATQAGRWNKVHALQPPRSGFLKATSAAASTTSAMTGC